MGTAPDLPGPACRTEASPPRRPASTHVPLRRPGGCPATPKSLPCRPDAAPGWGGELRGDMAGGSMLITPAATVPQSPFVIDWIGQESLRYTFDVLRLWGMSPERVLSTTFYELWPLSDDVVAALRTADEATLRAIGEHIMTDSLEQVRGRLGLA